MKVEIVTYEKGPLLLLFLFIILYFFITIET